MEPEEVERLLDAVHGSVGPAIWPRVEELVQAVVGLYGEGLTRVVGHLRELGRFDGALAERLSSDELVASLLLLHGLHPVPLRSRVEMAVDGMRARVRLGGGDLELLSLDADGVARLRLVGGSQALEQAIREAIESAAPEIAAVTVEHAESAAGLVQLRRKAAAAAPDPAGIATEPGA